MSSSGSARHIVSRPDGSPVRILVVDEPHFADVLATTLAGEGWDVRSVADGLDAIRVVREFEPDAVILEVGLPTLDGLSVIRRLRQDGYATPIVLLSTQDSVEDRIAGLEAGADHYLTKPFALTEMVLRLAAMLRHTVPTQRHPERLLSVGDLTLDEVAHEVRRGDRSLTLTTTEYKLLQYLMRHRGEVLSREQILQEVWHYDFGDQSDVVALYISYLRRKVDAGLPRMIHTRPGEGYLLTPAVETDAAQGTDAAAGQENTPEGQQTTPGPAG